MGTQGQRVDCQVHLGEHLVTQNKSLSQKVPRQRVATLSQSVYWQPHPEEHVVTQTKSLSQKVPLQHVATLSQHVSRQLPLEMYLSLGCCSIVSCYFYVRRRCLSLDFPF